jgi:hypothetical protein
VLTCWLAAAEVAPLTLSTCPGAIFEPVLRNSDPTQPIYEPSSQTIIPIHLDPTEAVRTIQKLQQADVQDNILMVAAHDESLLDILEFFPSRADEFMQKGWIQKARWRFLMDFAKAVGYEGEVEGKRHWACPS